MPRPRRHVIWALLVVLTALMPLRMGWAAVAWTDAGERGAPVGIQAMETADGAAGGCCAGTNETEHADDQCGAGCVCFLAVPMAAASDTPPAMNLAPRPAVRDAQFLTPVETRPPRPHHV